MWLEEEARLEKPITWDQFFEGFPWEILSRNSSEGDERTIYQIAAEELDRRRICCRVFETASSHHTWCLRREPSQKISAGSEDGHSDTPFTLATEDILSSPLHKT